MVCLRERLEGERKRSERREGGKLRSKKGYDHTVEEKCSGQWRGVGDVEKGRRMHAYTLMLEHCVY